MVQSQPIIHRMSEGESYFTNTANQMKYIIKSIMTCEAAAISSIVFSSRSRLKVDL